MTGPHSSAGGDGRSVLVRCLLDPTSTLELTPRDWNRLLLQARTSGLIGRLEASLREAAVFNQAPFKARSHMHAGAIAVLSTQTAVRFEVDRILRALRGVDVPLLLMKGSAYVHAGLHAARGRFVGDVDLMVPRRHIDAVERRLVECGWVAADLGAYDQRYYREWAHEIPPLQHPDRDTPVDVHHTILPLTARMRPDAAAILSAAVPLADARLQVMAPADMVLHSAVHLFNDEVSMPLRDLFDQHDLLQEFGAGPEFWASLLERARLHGLQRPAFYLLRQLRRTLSTPVPEQVFEATRGWGPPAPVAALMALLLDLRFEVDERASPRPAKSLAVFALYLRAHWLRMPPGLLVRHLAVKSWRRWRGEAPAG